MLLVEDLCVALNRRPVLRGISLSARPGTLTAIVGPNGSGKTTLLRAMTGEVAYQGKVTLNGLDVARAKAWQLAAIRAVMAQETQLAFPFSVLEVIRLGLTSGQNAEVRDLPQRALAEVGLTPHASRNYQDLSGGERQRVQLARALVQVWHPVAAGGARWLFLDEPVASLDLGHQLQVMRLARRFADAGGGVVAVMHDLNLSAMFADRLALLAEGGLVAAGAPENVLTDALLSSAYGCAIRTNALPSQGTWLLPQAVAG
ncbi:heme ABC transporter ATP-binding protein [Cypionkella sp.]|uniref:heme ABC transporter ATP-binding protein n=1 Tax=Cypionkella sp. TaxID=2811411 RepID=UPI002ABD0BB7|nr:heme ABC transporter ATP-binding protein [Cypionkella sp.]MDZ4392008.1 heme ABC transporter ATP-binding protein [Cypionkella sp.]